MAVLKCKMCGGTLEISNEETVATCEYCGTQQTVPNIDDEKKLKLYERANKLRYNCDFDKAAGIYESIVSEYSDEAEAYWGLVLCKYGIEYVDDSVTGKKIPTCHRSSFDCVMDDSDFEMVMENADSVARSVYRAEAKQIEEIRKGIVEVSGKEEPYDVFICYKETDEDGQRTMDSVLAQDVYDALTDKGYRVFFSRITLEDKLGREYEPYIFAALNSAKVMLAFSTSYDHYNAIWVKNEWSRYLKLMEGNKEKHLIPCYKDIDAYDIPKEFVKLQAQDMGKVGAVQDLVRGIEKLIGVKQEDKVVENQVVSSNGAMVEALLERVFMFLGDEDWDSADEYCERVLDLQPKNAKAYLGKLMAEVEASSIEKIGTCGREIDNSKNYRKILQFADKELKERIVELAEEAEESATDAEELKEKALMQFVMEEMENFDTPHTINELRVETGLGVYSWEQLVVLFRKMEERNLLYKFTYEKKNYYILAVKTSKKIYEEALDLANEGKYADAIQKLEEIIGEYKEANLLKSVLEEINQKAVEIKNKYQKNIDNLSDKVSKHKADIAEIEEQLSKLGFFAGKEKKRLSAEIEGIDAIINSLEDELKHEMNSMETELMKIPERNKIKQFYCNEHSPL